MFLCHRLFVLFTFVFRQSSSVHLVISSRRCQFAETVLKDVQICAHKHTEKALYKQKTIKTFFKNVCSCLLASADSVSVLKKEKKTRLREFASLNMKSILKKVHINLMSTDSSASTIPLEKQRIYHTVCVGVGRCVGFINYTVYIYLPSYPHALYKQNICCHFCNLYLACQSIE